MEYHRNNISCFGLLRLPFFPGQIGRRRIFSCLHSKKEGEHRNLSKIKKNGFEKCSNQEHTVLKSWISDSHGSGFFKRDELIDAWPENQFPAISQLRKFLRLKKAGLL